MPSRRKSPSRGWIKSYPKIKSQRALLYHNCGSKCFLEPKKLKYPICTKRSRTCKPDCRGILSAYKRSRQFKDIKTSRKASKIAKNQKCKWTH